MTWRVIHADCIEAMRELGESSVDAVVTDPPYGLHFMGKTWDQFGGPTGARHTGGNGSREPGGAMLAGEYDLSAKGQHGYQQQMTVFGVEALRVLKPGGHLLSFGGTRTIHRLICALEDAGFEIRDMLCWMFGSGFPKSRNLDGEWKGWGTALKPAWEGITLARKPLSGTVAQNVLEYGTGSLNIDGTRIGTDGEVIHAPQSDPGKREGVVGTDLGITRADRERFQRSQSESVERTNTLGRWPANVLLDPEAAEILDEQSGERPAGGHPNRRGLDGERSAFGTFNGGENARVGVQNTTGGASRFFYTAKTSRAERERGVREYGEVEERIADPYGEHRGRRMEDKSRFDGEPPKMGRNHHPTVKPVDLMQWLCRLITPPGGLVLDPFLGSGSTGIAALREGFDFIGIEREAEYVEIARARIIGDAPLFAAGSEVVAGNTPS